VSFKRKQTITGSDTITTIARETSTRERAEAVGASSVRMAAAVAGGALVDIWDQTNKQIKNQKHTEDNNRTQIVTALTNANTIGVEGEAGSTGAARERARGVGAAHENNTHTHTHTHTETHVRTSRPLSLENKRADH